METATRPREDTRRDPEPGDDAVRPLIFPPRLFLAALLLGVGLGWLFPLSIFDRAWVAHAAGWPVFLLGFGLARVAHRAMRRAQVDPRFQPVATIVKTGPFARSRNPLYLTVSLVYAGLALVCNTWWPLVLYPVVFAILHHGVVLREERYLEARFGPAYHAYCQRVRRWL